MLVEKRRHGRNLPYITLQLMNIIKIGTYYFNKTKAFARQTKERKEYDDDMPSGAPQSEQRKCSGCHVLSRAEMH
jgi:hypothetical protein